MIATSTLNNNSIACEEMFSIQQCIAEDNFLNNFFFKKKKKKLLHLYHTYCKVVYETHSGKFIQQLMKVKGFEYFEHSN
jgi:hypothetical protein